jgi:hypothetical protein
LAREIEGSKMEIDFKDERYFCNKIEVEVIISSINELECESNNKCQKLLSHAIDCDHKNICGVVESSNGDKLFDWRKCVHPELLLWQ